MNKTIRNPYWGNQEKTQIVAEFVYEDGTVQVASIVDVAGGNPDWQETMANFSREEIDANTNEKLLKHRRNQDKIRKQREAEDVRRRQEDLFASKLDAFEIAAVKNSTNRELKSGIRKAKSMTEVFAYTAALIVAEQQAAQAAATDVPADNGTTDGTTV